MSRYEAIALGLAWAATMTALYCSWRLMVVTRQREAAFVVLRRMIGVVNSVSRDLAERNAKIYADEERPQTWTH